MTSNDLRAYAAGFFEGDGCAYIGTCSEGYAKHEIRIAQKDRGILDWLRQQLEIGRVNGPYSGGMHQLVFSPRPARQFARWVLPYVRMERKRELLEQMLGGPTPEARHPFSWPYFAGVVDSDGSIGIYDQKSAGKTYPTPRLTVAQKGSPYLQTLVDGLGTGSVSGHTLSLGSGATRRVCENILPYLRVKRRAAEEVLALGHKTPSDSIYTRPEVAQARRLYVEEGLSASAVARRIGQKPATVNYWLRELGVTRSLAEAQQLRRTHEASP